jgi:magnesium-transporting ATPase (P-type)
MARLETSRQGLGSAEAARRLAKHGPNTIAEAARRPWLASLATQFLDVPVLLLLGAVAIAVALQLAIIYLPAFNRLFRTEPLPLHELGLTLAAAALVFAAVELEKWVRRRRA